MGVVGPGGGRSFNFVVGVGRGGVVQGGFMGVWGKGGELGGVGNWGMGVWGKGRELGGVGNWGDPVRPGGGYPWGLGVL